MDRIDPMKINIAALLIAFGIVAVILHGVGRL